MSKCVKTAPVLTRPSDMIVRVHHSRRTRRVAIVIKSTRAISSEVEISLLFQWERRFPLASTHWQRTRPQSMTVPEGSYHMTSQLDGMCFRWKTSRAIVNSLSNLFFKLYTHFVLGFLSFRHNVRYKKNEKIIELSVADAMIHPESVITDEDITQTTMRLHLLPPHLFRQRELHIQVFIGVSFMLMRAYFCAPIEYFTFVFTLSLSLPSH